MQRSPRPVGKALAELLGTTLDPLMRKRGLARAEMLAWWPEIVGADYAGRTAPERIRWPRDGTTATLVIRCDASLCLQLTHEVDRVRERLNAFFGYPAVGAVKVVRAAIGEPQPRRTERPASGEIRADTGKRLAGLDESLRDSFARLARNIARS